MTDKQAQATPDADPPEVPVHVAWARVMRAVDKIAKGDRNDQQHFNFRGVDATMNAVGPILREHGVFVVPESVTEVREERFRSKNDANMHGVILRVAYRVYGPAGDSFPIETAGESADSGDKATPKAHSVSFRTALLQALCVPTGDRDPDADSYDRAGQGDAQPSNGGRSADKPVDPRQQLWNDILARAKQRKLSQAEVREDYKSKHGHEIDGAEATPAELTAYFHSMAEPPAAGA